MEVKMQTSFIPKKPVVESRSGGSNVSLFLLLSIIVFIVIVAMSGGIWLWRESLEKKLDESILALASARDTYDDGAIKDLIRLNDRMTESQSLLDRHLAVSPVFLLLEKYIVKNISLKTMKFSYAGDGKIKLDLTGTALDYDALSKQSDIFGSEKLREFISSPVISDFNPQADGRVSFGFSALVSPDLVAYSKVSTTLADEIINSPISTSTATSSATTTNR